MSDTKTVVVQAEGSSTLPYIAFLVLCIIGSFLGGYFHREFVEIRAEATIRKMAAEKPNMTLKEAAASFEPKANQAINSARTGVSGAPKVPGAGVSEPSGEGSPQPEDVPTKPTFPYVKGGGTGSGSTKSRGPSPDVIPPTTGIGQPPGDVQLPTPVLNPVRPSNAGTGSGEASDRR